MQTNAQIIGYITGDVKQKTIGQLTVYEFSVSSKARFKKDSDGKKWTNFYECQLWATEKNQSESSKLIKGNYVAFDAEIVQDRWEKDGQKASKIRFSVDGWITELKHRHDASKPEISGNNQPVNQNQFIDDIPGYDDQVPF